MLCRFVGSNYVEILILPDSDSGQIGGTAAY